jgi:hypothetical protein
MEAVWYAELAAEVVTRCQLLTSAYDWFMVCPRAHGIWSRCYGYVCFSLSVSGRLDLHWGPWFIIMIRRLTLASRFFFWELSRWIGGVRVRTLEDVSCRIDPFVLKPNWGMRYIPSPELLVMIALEVVTASMSLHGFHRAEKCYWNKWEFHLCVMNHGWRQRIGERRPLNGVSQTKWLSATANDFKQLCLVKWNDFYNRIIDCATGCSCCSKPRTSRYWVLQEIITKTAASPHCTLCLKRYQNWAH